MYSSKGEPCLRVLGQTRNLGCIIWSTIAAVLVPDIQNPPDYARRHLGSYFPLTGRKQREADVPAILPGLGDHVCIYFR